MQETKFWPRSDCSRQDSVPRRQTTAKEVAYKISTTQAMNSDEMCLLSCLSCVRSTGYLDGLGHRVALGSPDRVTTSHRGLIGVAYPNSSQREAFHAITAVA